MDGFMNKARDAMNSSNSNSTTTGGAVDPNTQTGATGMTGNTGATGNTAAAGGSEDYGDKGLDFLEKKTGRSMGRDTNEKITDGARGLFEKVSGKKVDSKYSN